MRIRWSYGQYVTVQHHVSTLSIIIIVTIIIIIRIVQCVGHLTDIFARFARPSRAEFVRMETALTASFAKHVRRGLLSTLAPTTRFWVSPFESRITRKVISTDYDFFSVRVEHG